MLSALRGLRLREYVSTNRPAPLLPPPSTTEAPTPLCPNQPSAHRQRNAHTARQYGNTRRRRPVRRAPPARRLPAQSASISAPPPRRNTTTGDPGFRGAKTRPELARIADSGASLAGTDRPAVFVAPLADRRTRTGGSSQLAREGPKPAISMKMVALARPNTVFSAIPALKGRPKWLLARKLPDFGPVGRPLDPPVGWLTRPCLTEDIFEI